LPVVGTLPLVPNRDARQLLRMDETGANPEQLALREAVDGIRTVVLHAGRQQPLHVLLVASALHGEGKTTLATQLATSLARSGRRTLLVDCDLRHPSCHDLFDRPAAPGVCEVLRGEVPVEDALQNTEQALLFLLPAGRLDGKALQALAQDVPRTLFAVLREHFEFIVVDTSPLLPVSDTLQIADHADGVLLAVMEQNSQLPAVHKAQQKVAMLGGRILGAVVGGTQQEVYLYGSRSRAALKTQEV
jgi:capsular exopolysaccharide synthesis family protein